MATKKTTSGPLDIRRLEYNRLRVHLLGTTPMFQHRFGWKARQELLLPSATKNRTEKETSLKHDPVSEFRSALCRSRSASAATFVHLAEGALKGAIASAALDIPGITRARIDRLVQVEQQQIDLYGTPFLHMGMVRNSDPGRTPDVRTRPLFKRWALTADIRFVKDLVTKDSLVNLVATAGMTIGFGDWRPEKGGDFGQFEIVEPNDKEYRDVLATEGRAAQQAHFDHPVCYDEETQELLTWFEAEVKRRERGDMLAVGRKRSMLLSGANGEDAEIEEMAKEGAAIDAAMKKRPVRRAKRV